MGHMSNMMNMYFSDFYIKYLLAYFFYNKLYNFSFIVIKVQQSSIYEHGSANHSGSSDAKCNV